MKRRSNTHAAGENDRKASPVFEPMHHTLGRPKLRIWGPLTYGNINGEWYAGALDGYFIVCWGDLYAYLHQFDPISRSKLIHASAAAFDRRYDERNADAGRRQA